MLMTGRYELQKQAKQAHQKKIVLELFAHEPLSRTQLAEQLGLSLTAVSALTEGLMAAGLVEMRKKESLSATGRPPELLGLRAEGAYFLVLAVRRSGVTGAAYDLHQHRAESFMVPYPPELGLSVPETDALRQVSADALAAFLADALAQNLSEQVRHCAQAVVLSMPGTRAGAEEDFLSVPLKAVIAGDFVGALSRRVRLPVTFGNGSDFCAYGEKPALGCPEVDFLYISMHYGVGAGAICGGTIFQLGCGHSTEFGHMSIDSAGRPCSCGGRGCLERYVGFDAILEAMRARTGEQLTVEEMASHYRAGDGAADEVMADVARKLIFALSNLTSVFRLQRVVFGGGIEQFGPRFLDCLRTTLAQSAVRPQFRRTELCYTTLDAYGELYGAARYLFEQVWLPGETLG